MPLTVEHRPDNLLQENAAVELGPDLADTYVGRVSVPHERLLLKFLDERVVGKEFADQAALVAVLSQWPAFARENNLNLHKDWDEVELEGNNVVCGESMYTSFVVAVVKTIKSL